MPENRQLNRVLSICGEKSPDVKFANPLNKPFEALQSPAYPFAVKNQRISIEEQAPKKGKRVLVREEILRLSAVCADKDKSILDIARFSCHWFALIW